jgi:hypothetical protein
LPPYIHNTTSQALVAYGRPTWEPIPSTVNAEKSNAITGSADGQVLVAAANTWLWRTADAGKTWVKLANTNLGFWATVQCNNAATVCLAVTAFSLGFGNGALYRSVDQGATWSAVAGGEGRWSTLWCDPSGSTWFAGTFSQGPGTNGWLYMSTNGGLSFTQIAGTNIERWGGVACDSSATKCVVVSRDRPNGDFAPIYTSNNGLQTITEVPNFPYGIVFGVTMSADGEKVIVPQTESSLGGNGPGYVWHSKDGAQTFQMTNAPRRYYYGVSCDAAFTMCAVAPNGDENYDPVFMQTSCDGGRTWNEDPVTKGGWLDTQVNADGGLMYATVDTPNPKHIYSFPLPMA